MTPIRLLIHDDCGETTNQCTMKTRERGGGRGTRKSGAALLFCFFSSFFFVFSSRFRFLAQTKPEERGRG